MTLISSLSLYFSVFFLKSTLVRSVCLFFIGLAVVFYINFFYSFAYGLIFLAKAFSGDWRILNLIFSNFLHHILPIDIKFYPHIIPTRDYYKQIITII